MPIKFDLFENPEREGVEVPEFHAKVITKGLETTRTLRESIQKKCTVTASDVEAVLTALGDEMFEAFSNGYSVYLHGIGYFSLSLKCSPDINLNNISSSDIKVKGIRFQPDKELSRRLSNVEFVHMKNSGRHSSKMNLSEITEKIEKYFTDNQILRRPDFENLRRPDFEKLTGFNKSKSIRTLKLLVEEGMLKNIGTMRMPIYVLR